MKKKTKMKQKTTFEPKSQNAKELGLKNRERSIRMNKKTKKQNKKK
jgi:hypothetical protein